MHDHALPTAGWYADPEYPTYLRYWDGSSWTEHLAAPEQPTHVGQPADVVQPMDQDDGRSFTVVVAGVLFGALFVIAGIFTVMVWFDSYGNGSSRGNEAAEHGIGPEEADEYCKDLASSVTSTGSADGYWDFPWILGCKRALG